MKFKMEMDEIQDGDGNSFILYLKQEMEKDLKISINLKNCEIPILNGQNSKINDLINDINNQLDNKNFISKLDLENYLKFSDIFQKNNTVGDNSLNDVKESQKYNNFDMKFKMEMEIVLFFI